MVFGCKFRGPGGGGGGLFSLSTWALRVLCCGVGLVACARGLAVLMLHRFAVKSSLNVRSAVAP